MEQQDQSQKQINSFLQSKLEPFGMDISNFDGDQFTDNLEFGPWQQNEEGNPTSLLKGFFKQQSQPIETTENINSSNAKKKQQGNGIDVKTIPYKKQQFSKTSDNFQKMSEGKMMERKVVRNEYQENEKNVDELVQHNNQGSKSIQTELYDLQRKKVDSLQKKECLTEINSSNIKHSPSRLLLYSSLPQKFQDKYEEKYQFAEQSRNSTNSRRRNDSPIRTIESSIHLSLENSIDNGNKAFGQIHGIVLLPRKPATCSFKSRQQVSSKCSQKTQAKVQREDPSLKNSIVTTSLQSSTSQVSMAGSLYFNTQTPLQKMQQNIIKQSNYSIISEPQILGEQNYQHSSILFRLKSAFVSKTIRHKQQFKNKVKQPPQTDNTKFMIEQSQQQQQGQTHKLASEFPLPSRLRASSHSSNSKKHLQPKKPLDMNSIYSQNIFTYEKTQPSQQAANINLNTYAYLMQQQLQRPQQIISPSEIKKIKQLIGKNESKAKKQVKSQIYVDYFMIK